MRPRTLQDVATATGGRPVPGGSPGPEVLGAATDSREVRPGDLFVAIPGRRVDGHAHVAEAFERGAGAALVSVGQDWPGPVVVVEDTRRALLALAASERKRIEAHVVGVTGSTGKTSVKDLAAAVLSARFRTAASPRSFNTDVGVPLTLLNAAADAEALVVEMGSRGRGHIAELCEVARPEVGVVTNVGVAHLEMFGSAKAVADAKAELVESLPAEGTAVLNADSAIVRGFASRTRARVMLFGTTVGAQVRGEDLVLDRSGRASFTLRTPGGGERVELAVAGEHMAWNALAAAACGVALGLSAGECAAGLKEARVSPARMEVLETADGLVVINDAYNANPASMAAALKTARWIAGDGRCIAVLGEMAELGPIADQEHERLGELLARLGVDHVLVVGPGAARIAVGATREGVEPERVATCADPTEALASVRALVRPGDTVLVKGSRVAGLELVAQALAGEARDR